MPFRAPIADIRFLLEKVTDFPAVAATPRFTEASPETVESILAEAGKLAEAVLAPLQRVGDTDPARLENGVVRTPAGFGDGFRAIAEGGWLGIAAPAEVGGMGLPQTLATAVNDIFSGACLALQLNPLMSQAQVEALDRHGSDELKAIYIPKLLSGEWCGTMNLTEPQAGSDVGALSTKAEPDGQGSYRITGQKIYITWADNDFSENMCHLVLARLPDAVPGTKGISLFMVPKFLPGAAGGLGERNALRVVSLEHKLGLHGSPTAVMSYEGARGWLVGEPNGGMAAMFTMMNNARLGVGIQAIGVAEAATQAALAYAMERRQGRAGGTGTIVEHADVRRMLATMRAETFAGRAIALMCATAIDLATATGERRHEAEAAFLTPITKAFGTEVGISVANMGIQVHGGMGFIEETGAAQFLRDVRVTAIYEGTNGIQAIDLVGRKLADGGEAAFRLIDRVAAGAEAAKAAGLERLAGAVWDAAESLRETTEWLVAQPVPDRQAGAVAYLMAFARVLGAHAHLSAARQGDDGRRRLAEFYIGRLLPEHRALLAQVEAGPDSLLRITPDDLAA